MSWKPSHFMGWGGLPVTEGLVQAVPRAGAGAGSLVQESLLKPAPKHLHLSLKSSGSLPLAGCVCLYNSLTLTGPQCSPTCEKELVWLHLRLLPVPAPASWGPRRL